MNVNAIIAVLEIKGIITREEGEKLSEHIANKPQSTLLADAVEQIKELISDELPKLKAVTQAEVKKAVAQAKPKVEAAAKTEANKVVSEVASEVKKVTDTPAKK